MAAFQEILTKFQFEVDSQHIPMLLSLQWGKKSVALKLADKLKEVISELHLNSIIRMNSLRVLKS